MIVRHHRESATNRGFRHLARYIQGQASKPRATWFLAANLPGVTRADDHELACHLVDAVQAQNTRAGSKRTYHLVISLHPDDRCLKRGELQHVVESLVDTLGFSEHQYIAVRHNDTDHEHIHVATNKIHPETFRIHSPAWDHQKLFTGARAIERELGLTPLRSRTRDREKIPERAIDCEAHQGINSFARWARRKLRPALRSSELRTWDDVHDVCSRLGVVARPRGNGLVFEDATRAVRVKASFVDRELSKTRLCERLGEFQPAWERQLEAAREAPHRYSPMPARAPQSLWKEYEQTLQEARARRERDWAS
ncbi:MAG: TraI/MobA(P) family conjugative relaxase, partial [Polyangiales bacterium]